LTIKFLDKREYWVLVVGPLFLDWVTDLNTMRNYMTADQLEFGFLPMALFAYVAMKDGRLWIYIFGEINKLLELGYQTSRMLEMRRGKVQNEAIISFMLNMFGFPFDVTGTYSFCAQLLGIALRFKSIAAEILERELLEY